MKTTITVSKNIKNELNKLKYLYGLKSIEDVIIKYIFQDFNSFKPKEEDLICPMDNIKCPVAELGKKENKFNKSFDSELPEPTQLGVGD